MRFKVANYSRLEIRLDTLHIYNEQQGWPLKHSAYLEGCEWLKPAQCSRDGARLTTKPPCSSSPLGRADAGRLLDRLSAAAFAVLTTPVLHARHHPNVVTALVGRFVTIVQLAVVVVPNGLDISGFQLQTLTMMSHTNSNSAEVKRSKYTLAYFTNVLYIAAQKVKDVTVEVIVAKNLPYCRADKAFQVTVCMHCRITCIEIE